MDKISFHSLYQDTAESLKANKLLQALAYIKGMIFNVNEIEFTHEFSSIHQDYDFMLRFVERGGKDSQREKIYHNLINRTYRLLDKIMRIYRIENINDTYTYSYRSLSTDFNSLTKQVDLLNESFKYSRTANRQKHSSENRNALNETYRQMFNYIWTAPIFREDEAEELETYISQQDTNEQALLISAVMLNSLEYFDPYKFRILLHLSRSDMDLPRARAIVATTLVYMKFKYRFSNYPELVKELLMLGENARIKEELTILQYQLLLSLETTKVEKKLQNEIFPNLISNKNYNRNKLGLQQIEEELSKALEGNADPINGLFSDKRLEKNMKEIIEMGQEGIDINIGTFASLKSFAFFKETANWFLPFDSTYPEIEKLFTSEQSNNSIKVLINSGNLCDSDKYSLSLMLCSLPIEQSNMMISQIEAQFADSQEQIKDMGKSAKDIKHIYRFYLQDLYRFFKLGRNKSQFSDPFKQNLLFSEYKELSEIVKDIDYLKKLAPHLIKRGFYADAIAYLEEIIKTDGSDHDSLKRLAFCYQKNNDYNKAIYYYQQADLLSPDNEWVLSQMNSCYSAMNRHDLQLKCLKKLKDINPDNLNINTEMGYCLMQLNRHEEAANCFHELEYKGKKPLLSWRAIAWCNFKMDKMEQAEKYYTKILLSGKAEWSDHLNSGHVAWCMNKIEESIKHYRNYIGMAKNQPDIKDIMQPFNDDADELRKHGITRLDICLMRDIITPDFRE